MGSVGANDDVPADQGGPPPPAQIPARLAAARAAMDRNAPAEIQAQEQAEIQTGPENGATREQNQAGNAPQGQLSARQAAAAAAIARQAAAPVERTILPYPADVYLEIIKWLEPAERQAVRLACYDLLDLVDENIGPIDDFWLRDGLTPEQLAFFRSTCFKSIVIKAGPCLTLDPTGLLYKPLKVASLRVEGPGRISHWTAGGGPTGVVNANFLWAILRQIPRLRKLNVSGNVQGIIEDEGTTLALPYLKHLEWSPIDFTLHEGSDWALGRSRADDVRPGDILCENQLTLLRRLVTPSLETLILELEVLQNGLIDIEVYDDQELASALFGFLGRHPKVKVWKLFARTMNQGSWLTRPLYSRRVQRLDPAAVVEPPDPLQFPDTSAFEVQEISFLFDVWSTPWHKAPFRGYLLQLLASIRGLQIFRMLESARVPMGRDRMLLPWAEIQEIISTNRVTLKEIVLFGWALEMASLLDLMATCPKLEMLWLRIQSQADPPLDLPATTITANLTTLILASRVQLQAIHLDNFHQMARLKYLSLYGLQTVVPLAVFQAIMGMRSLEEILLPHWLDEGTIIPVNFPGDRNRKLHELLQALEPFLWTEPAGNKFICVPPLEVHKPCKYWYSLAVGGEISHDLGQEEDSMEANFICTSF